MMGRYVLSPRAQTGLDVIWDYMADRRGLGQPETYARAIWQRIEAVAQRPAMGQDTSDIPAGYYKFPAARMYCFTASPPKGSMSCAFCMNAWSTSATFLSPLPSSRAQMSSVDL
jgi:plasmid stabilization system protein ParE